MAASYHNSTADVDTKPKKENVMTGPLSDDFLRISQQEDAVDVQQQAAYGNMFNGFQQAGGILTITVIQARLAKNYGVTRMDPYCRLRIGMQVFETPTAYNGSKTPRWNKVIQCHINDATKEIYLEVFDERTFSIDERIAWGLIEISDDVFTGNIIDKWYTISGKQGDEKEGMLQVVLQYKKSTAGPVLMGGPMMMGPMGYPQTPMVYGYPPMMYAPPQLIPGMQPQQQPLQQHQQRMMQPQQQPVVNEINEKDLKTLKEMCPELDDEIIKSVLLQAGGNIDRAAIQLLEMSAS